MRFGIQRSLIETKVMKIAVTATEPSLHATVDPRLGRCAYFVFVDTDDMNFEAMANDSNSQGGGAGIQSARVLAQKGVRAVLTGNCGPNAHQTLTAAGIDIVVGCSGTVREAVDRFILGDLQVVTAPNVASHSGTSRV